MKKAKIAWLLALDITIGALMGVAVVCVILFVGAALAAIVAIAAVAIAAFAGGMFFLGYPACVGNVVRGAMKELTEKADEAPAPAPAAASLPDRVDSNDVAKS